jgi:hypothetical protein
MLANMNTSGTEITPHLDKRWHLPAYMPDLNIAGAEQDRIRINRAFLLGMMYEILQANIEDGKLVWIYFGGSSGNEIIKVHNKTVEGVPCKLHNALKFNPSVVDRVLSAVQTKMENDRRRMPGSDKLSEHVFIKSLLRDKDSIFEILYSYPEGEPENNKLPGIINKELRPLLVDEAINYFLFVFGSHQTNSAYKSAIKYMKQMVSCSKRIAQASGKDSYANAWKKYIEDRIEKLI